MPYDSYKPTAEDLVYKLYGKDPSFPKEPGRCCGYNGHTLNDNLMLIECNYYKLFTNFCEDHIYIEYDNELSRIFEEIKNIEDLEEEISFCTSCKTFSKRNNTKNI